jgi:hypothetical protein
MNGYCSKAFIACSEGKGMAKISMTCPFSNKTCIECAIFRGKHHYLTISRQHHASTNQQKDHGKSRVLPLSVEFQALKNSVERYLVLPTFPSTGKYNEKRGNPEIKLKVIDVENRTSRTCDFDESRNWIWDNPEIMRVIDGWQVTSMEMLLEIMCHKAEKGCEEVELYEAPRFMLLAGG